MRKSYRRRIGITAENPHVDPTSQELAQQSADYDPSDPTLRRCPACGAVGSPNGSRCFQRLVSGQTPHVKHVLRALALLTEKTEETRFRTAEVYDTYEKVVSQTESPPSSYDRVRRLLKEQAFLGITESEHTGGGHGEGSYRVHQLLRYPEVVVEALDRE